MNEQSAAYTLKPKDFKSDLKPVWCPGCGDFAVLAAMTRAFAEMKYRPEEIGVVSGIGCSSRLPAYVKAYGFHSVHGRALPVATGLKQARPDLKVFAVGGDGDGFSIGGNHFLHACRRNADFTYIVMDNEVYGMTKGQASPTTQGDWTKSKLTPEGTHMPQFQPLEIALSAGANFIARGFTGRPQELTQLIIEAEATPGFSFIHVLSSCVTFRPDTQHWKDESQPGFDAPTGDRWEAFDMLKADNGLKTGILYKGSIRPYAPFRDAPCKVEDLTRKFVV